LEVFELLPQLVNNVIVNFGWLTLGVLVGIIAGALPGFGGANTLIIFLPLTLALEVNAATTFMISVYCGVRLGGAIPAILVNVPGSGSAAVTTFDGYPLAVQGKGKTALGVSAGASLIGGIISGLVALLAAPAIGQLALKLSSVELFLITLSAIVVIGQFASGNLIKGLLAGAFGLLLGSTGTDAMYGISRANFGIMQLFEGVPVIPTLVGFFAISEIMMMIKQDKSTIEEERIDSKIGGIKEIFLGSVIAFKYWGSSLRSGIIGTFIGAIPAAGANIASFLAYQQEISFARKEEKSTFGKGNPKGIIAAEGADNAVGGGALIPLLTFAIPGNSTGVVMLTVLLAHGVVPGPRIFETNPIVPYSLIFSVFIASFVMYILGVFVFMPFASKVTSINLSILAPAIGFFALMGAYADRTFLFDMGLAIVLGVIGYLMRRGGYPPQAALLGVILAPLLEKYFYQALRMSFGDYTVFFLRPGAMIIWTLLIIIVAFPFVREKVKNRKEKTI